MKKLLSVLIVLLAIAGVVVVGLYTMNYMKKSRENVGAGQKPGRGGGGRNADTVYTVRTQPAKVQTLEDYVNTNGNVEALSSVSVLPNMGGKLVSISVNLGSQVKRGDIIARVDPSQPGVTYALSPVVAPIAGTVIATPLAIGTTVSTATAITTLGDISRLQVTTHVPERYVGYMQTGLKAEISLESQPGITFPATVTYVSPVLDAATRTKEIVLRFDEADSRINAGMFAKVKLYTVQYSGKVVVPSDAVVTNADKQYLFVSRGDTVSRQEVKLGNAVDGMVQILSGINENDRVVVEGGTALFDGAKINDISNN